MRFSFLMTSSNLIPELFNNCWRPHIAQQGSSMVSIASASPVHDDQDNLQDLVSPAPSHGSRPSLLVEVEPWDPDLYHCI